MSTSSVRGTSRRRSRAAVSLVAAAGLLTGLAVAVAAPASAATIPTPDPECVWTSGAGDSTAVLTSVAVSPRAIDVRAGAKKVVITAAAHDSTAIVRIRVSVGNGRKGGRPHVPLAADLTLVSGTALDGTWRGTLVVPRWVGKGTYRIDSVSLWDAHDALVTYGPSRPGWGSWSTSFAVRTVPDVTAPRLRSFTASTRSVNTSTRGKKVSFRVTMTDGQSGVGGVVVRVLRDQRLTRYVDAELRRSTKHKHVWRGTAVVPAWVGTGTRTWRFRVLASDRIANRRTWLSPQLAAGGWRSTLTVTSRADTIPPTLAGFTFSPTSVDARTGEKRVAFSIRVTDAQSGSTVPELNFGGVGGRYDAITYTGVTGSAHDRTFTGHLTVGRCGASGTYKAYLVLGDAADNFWDGTAEKITALGFASELGIEQIDGLMPTVEGPGTVPADGALTLTFNEPVLLDRPMGAALTVKVGAATALGTWACRNGASAVVVCDADGADVITATFTPSTPFASGDLVTVTPVATRPAPVGIYDLVGNQILFFGNVTEVV